MEKNSQFLFRKDDKIGVADAKMDRKVLLDNFINTGDYDVIASFDRPERFILGRAGAGKTALITQLSDKKENVIVIEPESLSLGYISNSTIIQNLSELGVDFDLFYRLLWRHVLGVEILKHHFGITDKKVQATTLDKLKDRFTKSNRKNYHARAIEYLEKWGSSFWQDTDYRIKELTSSMVSKLEGGIGLNAKVLSASVNGGGSITEEQKTEVVQRAQDVVNDVQMKELADLMKMLDEAIDDKQKYYYLVIDRLDENWVDESIRYRLIKALLETVKDFEVVTQVKPMVVLRNDLVARVYDQTRTAGFQEEKFSSLNLNVTWTMEQLIEMLDTRVNYLVKQRYTGQVVTHKDILPKNIRDIETTKYIVDRTLMRPRDIISFINFCIGQAVDSPIITEEMLLKAEREYSRDRRASIQDEWFGDYSSLCVWGNLLDSVDKEFFVVDIDLGVVEKTILEREPRENNRKLDKFDTLIASYLEERIDLPQFRISLLQAFYMVGYIGVDLLNEGDYMWSYQPRKILRVGEISEDTIFAIHPCFYSCFNINPNK